MEGLNPQSLPPGYATMYNGFLELHVLTSLAAITIEYIIIMTIDRVFISFLYTFFG